MVTARPGRAGALNGPSDEKAEGQTRAHDDRRLTPREILYFVEDITGIVLAQELSGVLGLFRCSVGEAGELGLIAAELFTSVTDSTSHLLDRVAHLRHGRRGPLLRDARGLPGDVAGGVRKPLRPALGRFDRFLSMRCHGDTSAWWFATGWGSPAVLVGAAESIVRSAVMPVPYRFSGREATSP